MGGEVLCTGGVEGECPEGWDAQQSNEQAAHQWWCGAQVVVDNHVWLEDPTAYENTPKWVATWAKLAGAPRGLPLQAPTQATASAAAAKLQGSRAGGSLVPSCDLVELCNSSWHSCCLGARRQLLDAQMLPLADALCS